MRVFFARPRIDPVLVYIVLATIAGGAASVLAAAVFTVALLGRLAARLVSYAIGVLLAVALLDVLPEAFRASRDVEGLFAALLAGVLGFFLLEKAALWRHDHEHEDRHAEARARRPAVLILVGDGFHNFVDGILIAAAFLTDVQLGLTTTLAVVAHEIPQEVGDFVVLLAAYTRRRALAYNLLSSLASIAGGLLGYVFLEQTQGAVPYVLALAAASFIYIALADLMPSLHQRWDARAAAWQIGLIGAGVATVALQH